MNKIVLIGRLTKDPELKYTPSTNTAVATFTIAVDRRMPNKDGQKEADFIPIVVWGKIAETTANFMKKGSLIGISGRIQTRNYDAKDGTKRYVTEVVAEEVQFLDKKSSNGDSSVNNSTPNSSTNTKDSSDTPVIDEGDIPF